MRKKTKKLLNRIYPILVGFVVVWIYTQLKEERPAPARRHPQSADSEATRPSLNPQPSTKTQRDKSADSEATRPSPYPQPSTKTPRDNIDPDHSTNPNAQNFSADHPRDFEQAKRILRKLFPRGSEFYCNCSYDLSSKRPIDISTCGFEIHSARGRRIEWEHVVPASLYGRRFKEWTAGDQNCQRGGRMERGRSCAREVSEDFRRMEADLFNLVPAIGELNRARGNFAFGQIAGESRKFGACDFEVEREKVEPRPAIRGDIARIYFYMDARYPGFGILDAESESLLSTWHREDPIDQSELMRIRAIEEAQGQSFFIGRLEALRKSASGL